LDQLAPRKDGASHTSKIKYVEDRQGHDFRYAIDDSYAQKELGFRRSYENFEKGLLQTVQWYLDNQNWVQSVKKKTAKS
jgi:dTDP-glucose 4,6-dehydratase